MKVKVKLLDPEAKLPTYATSGAACFDIYALESSNRELRGTYGCSSSVIRTGLSFEIPEGYVMKVYSRSGHGFNHAVRLANCVGIIDSDYRGELKIKLQGDFNSYLNINKGDRIAQGEVVSVNKVEFEEVNELNSSDRNKNGFGSTGY